MTLPPKPPARPARVSLWRYVKLFRQDILSAQPAKLYRAWMAEFRTPFFRSYMVNDPELLDLVLKQRPMDFPKSGRVSEGLRPLLGQSVFLTNGDTWTRQRRIIDPAFEGGRLRDTFPAMWAAACACVDRLADQAGGEVDQPNAPTCAGSGASKKARTGDRSGSGTDPACQNDQMDAPPMIEIEAETSHAAADVIFRTLFSIPIDHELARAVFDRFRDYQRTQPILNIAAFVPMPRWMPRFHRRRTRAAARDIRDLITRLTQQRQAAIADGTAPDDLATKIMTTRDPVTGQGFETAEMVDQVAIFFLAGHETSASALAWTLYLLATHPDWQEDLSAEAEETLGAATSGDMAQDADAQERPAFSADTAPPFSVMSKLKISRDCFREALRLYPPVPMMVRQSTCPEHFRDRDVKPGSQIVLSPWHLHRHERIWANPDGFDPARWSTQDGRACARDAYMPFSAGPRVCTGAGFAMVEGPLILSMILRRFRIEPIADRVPVPVAHLTVRSADGIWLRLIPR